MNLEGKILTKRVEDSRRLISALPSFAEPHIKFSLLRSCFTFPKLAFSLRTTDTSVHEGMRKEFDTLVKWGLEEILGVFSPTPSGSRPPYLSLSKR